MFCTTFLRNNTCPNCHFELRAVRKLFTCSWSLWTATLPSALEVLTERRNKNQKQHSEKVHSFFLNSNYTKVKKKNSLIYIITLPLLIWDQLSRRSETVNVIITGCHAIFHRARDRVNDQNKIKFKVVICRFPLYFKTVRVGENHRKWHDLFET